MAQLFDKVVGLIVEWIAAQCQERLPEEAAKGTSFKWDHQALFQVTVVAIPVKGLWSARFVTPIEPYAQRRVVPGRIWIVEFSVKMLEEELRLAVRIQCASTSHCLNIPFQRDCPEVVRTIASTCQLEETLVITKEPWRLEDEDSVQELYEAVIDPQRMMPIWVITQPARSLPCILSGSSLAEKGFCIGHTVMMPWELTFKWGELVSRAFSVFGGAVRTYQPGIDDFNQPSYMHPWAGPERLQQWSHRFLEGIAAYELFLLDKGLETISNHPVDFGECLFTYDAEVLRSRLTRESFQVAVKRGETVEQLRRELTELQEFSELYQQEVEALEKQLQRSKDDYLTVLRMASDWNEEKSYLQHENHSLHALSASLREAIKRKGSSLSDDDLPLPVTYEDLPQWIDAQLVDRMTLHPRAIQSLKKALFNDVELVCQSVLLLANEFRDMQIGFAGAKDRFHERLNELGLEFSKSITKTSAGEFGDEYYVAYPPGSQNNYFVEWHLRSGGNSRDPHRCLAIYFFWDTESNRVVLVSLPGHLRNQLT